MAIDVYYGDTPADDFKLTRGSNAEENFFEISVPVWIPTQYAEDVLIIHQKEGRLAGVWTSDLYFWLGREAESL